MANSIRLLGLAKKAGKLEIGEDSCGTAARAKKVKIILTARDSADNSVQRARNFSKIGNVPHVVLPYTKYDLGLEVGRGSPGMLGITDVGLAAKFVSELAREFPGGYEETSDLLAKKNEKTLRRRKEARAHERNVKMGKRRKTE